jgi:hypothetical protein
MPARPSKTSPALQTLIDKGLLERLPLSFSTFTFSQIEEWDLLFPAECSYYERLFGLLDRSDPSETERLFAPLRQVERKMGINEKVWPRRQFTLDQVDFLNRNASYSEWRQAVANIFARLDPLLDAEVARFGHARLVFVITPAEIPVDADRMWLRIRDHGKRIAVEPPEQAEDYLPLLLTGQPRRKSGPSIAGLYAGARGGAPYQSWIVEAGATLSAMASHSSVVKCSYEQLQGYRKRLMSEVRRLVSAEEIRGPRQLSARLKQLKALASEGDIARDPVVAEFARAVLLSANGTLLVNNTFVEWATVQAVRRARPSVVISSFGVRNKIKPFTSLLIYTDQDASSPIPTQMDTLGTYVDLEVFHQYLWQEFEKYAEYRRNTAYVFAADGMDQMLVIAPPDFPLQGASSSVTLDRAFHCCAEWLNLS